MIGTAVRLPRDGSRQGEGLLYGRLALTLNRWSGIIILGFIVIHLIAQAVLNVPMLAPVKAAAPWLPALQSQPWLHGVLFASITFHALYGFKLIALDLGARLDYRKSFWVICAISALVFVREVLRYAGF